jgi:serine phosphatase RsbU (regulator of sigma subunit)
VSSSQPSYVNDRPVTRPTILVDGDLIQLGQSRLKFEILRKAKSNTVDAVTIDPNMQAGEIVRSRLPGRPNFGSPSLIGDEAEGEAQLKISAAYDAVRAVSKAIADILDLDELLHQILHRMLDMFPRATRVVVLLADPETGELVPTEAARRDERDQSAIHVPSNVLAVVNAKREAVLSIDTGTDQRFQHAASVVSRGVRSILCAPLLWREELVGAVYLDSSVLSAFDRWALELLSAIADQCATAVGVAKLHKEVLDRERIKRELKLAEQIQRSFLPKGLPEYAGYGFAASYSPASKVGGDFYDFIEMAGQRLGVVVADISGKGVGAALYMARLTRDLRAFCAQDILPCKVLEQMNRVVVEAGRVNMFVTMLFALIDLPSGRMILANAGHFPPVLRNARGISKVLPLESSFPLGVEDKPEYRNASFTLKPGDNVLMYTDGLTEAMNHKDEMLGLERLVEGLRRGKLSAKDLHDRALEVMRAHVKGAPQHDDTTLVAFGRELQEAVDESDNGKTQQTVPAISEETMD